MVEVSLRFSFAFLWVRTLGADYATAALCSLCQCFVRVRDMSFLFGVANAMAAVLRPRQYDHCLATLCGCLFLGNITLHTPRS